MAKTQSLLDWQTGLFNDVFFQEDDKIAAKAFDEAFSKDLQVTINGAKLDHHAYGDALQKARAALNFQLLEVETLLTNESSENGAVVSGGSFAQKTVFSQEDAAGKVERKIIVGIITVLVEDGKRKIVQMTEVEKDFV